MARSSRHKSHRSHKHRDRSDSEDDRSSRDKKQRVEEDESARVSRVSEQEKKKPLSKDGVGTSNGAISGDHSKKRKDRGEDSGIGGDRWIGGGDDDARVEKEFRKENSDVADLEKSSKSKSLVTDLKGKSTSSRRREGSGERNDEKRRSEKESSRRESSGGQHKDVKEKERDRERERGSEKERERERGSEKEKQVHESRFERSDDGASRREGRSVKQGVEISELKDEMRNLEVEKDIDKRIKRRRDGSGDRDRLDDGRDGDDRQLSSRDGPSKNGGYKDGRYKEKYREELDRDQRHHDDKRRDDDKCRDERSSRTHTSERSDSKHYRDESRPSENRDRKTKLHDGDRDGSRHGDDHSAKIKDNRGRKRSSDETEDHSDMKSRSAKEPREDTAKNGSSSIKFDPRPDRARLEHLHIDKVDPGLTSSRTKNSPNSSAYAAKEQNRHHSRPRESTRRDTLSEDARRRDPLSEDTCRSGAGSRDHITSGGRERMTESRSAEKAKLKDNVRSDVFMIDTGSVHHPRIPRSGARNSPNQFTEKSPSSTNERRSDKITACHSIETEEVGQRSSSKRCKGDASFQKDSGRERDCFVEKPREDDIPQGELLKREYVPMGPSSSSRMCQLQGESPARLPPPPPVRYGVDSPSVLGSYEDESRIQLGERKTNARYKRGGDASMGRGPGTPWKNGPTWPSPVANGFIPPLQHGHPAGFHPGIPQFHAPPLFGIRPSMDLSNPSYHIHDGGTRFPGHARPFGWHNPVDDCPPHLQMWDGTTNVFGDESHIYGRPEWDHNRHLMSSRGWERNTDMWSGPNGNANMEFPVPQKEHEYSRQGVADEAWVGQSGCNARDERARSEQPVTDSVGIKLPSDTSPAKQTFGAASRSVAEKLPESCKMSSADVTSEKQRDNNVCYCSTYLSKIDISVDLVQPELYKQCMSLIEARDRKVTCNFSSQGQRKNNVDGFRLVATSKQYARNSLNSTVTDATFQRAMSLYWKQKAMRSASQLVCPEQNNHPETTDEENVRGDKGERLLLVNAASGDNMEEDGILVDNNVEGEHQQPKCDDEERDCSEPSEPSVNAKARRVDSSSDGKERGCDEISGAVMCVEGSEESEAIIPECRVNLSRIHLSPESTR